jgi:hypothetical protein
VEVRIVMYSALEVPVLIIIAVRSSAIQIAMMGAGKELLPRRAPLDVRLLKQVRTTNVLVVVLTSAQHSSPSRSKLLN